MLLSLSFNGQKKDYMICERGKRRTAFAPIKRNMIEMPGMPGAYLESTDTEVRIIEQPIVINGKDRFDVRKLEEDLAAWLITEKPVDLVFDDEPDRVYYAVVDGSINTEDIARFGKGTITFICPDPYKYGNDKLTTFSSAASFVTEGSAEVFPIVKCTIKQDTTFVAIGDGENNINMIGNAANVDQQPFQPQTRVFWKEMNTLVGWAVASSTEEGTISGTMQTDNYSFYTKDYGTGPAWHGPALKTSIGSSLQDFRAEALIRQIGANGQLGSLEVTLLDANTQVVARMMMSKTSKNSQANIARMRAGNSQRGADIINEYGDNPRVWDGFSGILRIQRIGNEWEAYVAKISPEGKYYAQRQKMWTDIEGIANAPIAQIQVQVRQYGTVPATKQHIDDLKVFRINDGTENQIPIVAEVGDIIEFDHRTDVIRRNGEEINKLKAFIGDYFPLKPGRNTIVAEPIDAIESTEVRWREAWR